MEIFGIEMQFVVIGRDGTDTEAIARRMATRDAHLQQCARMKSAKSLLYAVALQDETGAMNGSVMVVDFPSQAELDAWLEREPYVTQKVWQRIEVLPGSVAPIFT